MSEPGRLFAFDIHAAAGQRPTLVAPGVTISVRRPVSVLNVRGPSDDAAFERAIFDHFGVRLPAQPNTAIGTDTLRALWLGPDEWLVVSQNPLPDISIDLGAGTAVDVSHGRAVVRTAGPDVRAALAKGCGIDLHPREFPPGRCAQTAIAKVSVILDHVQPDVFDLYCPRSYAGSFWHWLTEACAEYGCRIG